jgi:hypothetical protein
MKQLSIILLVALSAWSCSKKQAEKDGYTDVPNLELVSISSNYMVQFKDSLIITVRYKDLNGDLGRQNPDDNALYIKDLRLPNADYYHVPPLTPDNLQFKTTGTFRIVVPSLFLLGNGGEEKTKLFVKVMDAAGHWSNEIATPEILIAP